MIHDPFPEEAALPTLRTRNWLILGLLVTAIGAWAAVGWLYGHMVEAVRAIGLPV